MVTCQRDSESLFVWRFLVSIIWVGYPTLAPVISKFGRQKDAQECTHIIDHKDHLLTSLTNRQITVKHTSAKACPGSKCSKTPRCTGNFTEFTNQTVVADSFYIFHSFIFLYDSPNRNIVFSHSFCETHRFFQLKAVKQGFSEKSPLFWTEPFLLRTSCFLTG